MLQGLVARISLVFAVVAVAAGTATMIDALALTDMATRVRILLARDLVEAVALTRSQNHLLRMNSNLAGAILANRQDYEAANNLVSRSLTDYRDRLRELHDASPEGAQQSDALARGFNEVEASAARIMDLMRAGDKAASRAAVATELTPAVERQVARARGLINEKWDRLEAERHATLTLSTTRRWEIIALGLLSLLPTLLGLGWLVGPGLRRPMRQITWAADSLRGGNLTQPVPGRERSDEVGAIAVSLEMLRQQALRTRMLEAEARDLEAAAEAARLRDLTDAAFEGLAITAEGTVCEANTSLASIFGVDRDAMIGVRLADLLRLGDGQPLAEVLSSAALSPTRAMLLTRDEEPLPVEIRTRRLAPGAGRVPRQVFAIRDLRHHAAAEAKIAHMAHHDSLTGMANRTQLAIRFREAMARTDRTGVSFAVLCIDLDRFKPINDLYGHTAGDRVLTEVASRLQAITRETDTIARLGGDEFVVLQAHVADAEEAAALALRVLAALRGSFEIGGQEPVSLSASVGIAMYPADGSTQDVLLANADSALYRVKRSARDGFVFFQADRDAEQHRRLLLQKDLRRALTSGELSLVYQPQMLSQTGKPAGFEALIRWHHSVHGAVPPGEFIPIAEDSGLIIDIGAWVLRQACAEAANWDAKLRIAVNVSPRQLEQDGFPAVVAAILAETGLEPSRLELEITEGLLIRQADRALKIIQTLKNLGVMMALDDFGTGFSSLGMLANFPFDRLKIDRAFVDRLTETAEARAIVSAIVALGHALHISVLAEGAETAAQFDILRAEGCDEVQGYLLGKPMKIENYRHFTSLSATSAIRPLSPQPVQFPDHRAVA